MSYRLLCLLSFAFFTLTPFAQTPDAAEENPNWVRVQVRDGFDEHFLTEARVEVLDADTATLLADKGFVRYSQGEPFDIVVRGVPVRERYVVRVTCEGYDTVCQAAKAPRREKRASRPKLSTSGRKWNKRWGKPPSRRRKS